MNKETIPLFNSDKKDKEYFTGVSKNTLSALKTFNSTKSINQFQEIFISMNPDGTFNVRDKNDNDLTKNFLIYIDKISKEIVLKLKK